MALVPPFAACRLSWKVIVFVFVCTDCAVLYTYTLKEQVITR